MKTILLHPTYFPCIAQMSVIAQSESVVFEIHDNYQKQTYRNRAYIAQSTGKLQLNIPIKHSGDGTRQAYKDIQVENAFPWQSQHWKTLQTAYRTSPFFEYYEDEIAPLFSESVSGLMDFNFKVYDLIIELLQLKVPFSFSSEYFKLPKQIDLRKMANVKKEPNYKLESYTQVFHSNHGFLSNLSVLDLLFNEGPNALDYLERQKIV